jgi:hypothetical protein
LEKNKNKKTRDKAKNPSNKSEKSGNKPFFIHNLNFKSRINWKPIKKPKTPSNKTKKTDRFQFFSQILKINFYTTSQLIFLFFMILVKPVGAIF